MVFFKCITRKQTFIYIEIAILFIEHNNLPGTNML